MEMVERFVAPAETEQCSAEVRLCHRVSGCDLQGVLPESLAVAPVADLAPANDREQAENDRRGCRGPSFGNQALVRPIRCGPNHEKENSDRRQIEVAIRSGSDSDLHQPNHWNERPQIPEPS